MDLVKWALSAFGKIGIIIAIAVAFVFGLTGTVYLSLRSHEVKVPDIVGKDRFMAEEALEDAGLNIRVRATRPVSDAKPDTIILQTPRAGEVVKVGQTIAVDVSRAAKEGESTITIGSLAKESLEEGKQSATADKSERSEPSPSEKNDNLNENKPKKPKNANNTNNANNKNANNSNANSVNTSNSATNTNAGTNANRNLNNRNITNSGNRNANGTANNRNANLNVNRNSNILNTNRRAPNVNTPPFVSPGTRTP